MLSKILNRKSTALVAIFGLALTALAFFPDLVFAQDIINADNLTAKAFAEAGPVIKLIFLGLSAMSATFAGFAVFKAAKGGDAKGWAKFVIWIVAALFFLMPGTLIGWFNTCAGEGFDSVLQGSAPTPC